MSTLERSEPYTCDDQLDLFASASPSGSMLRGGARVAAPLAERGEGFAAPLPAFSDAGPTARRNDPLTSHRYREGHPATNPQCARALIALDEWDRESGEATCAEITRTFRLLFDPEVEQASVARRLTSLHRQGLLEGTGESRDGGRGRPQEVHRLTAAGRDALGPARRLLAGEVAA